MHKLAVDERAVIRHKHTCSHSHTTLVLGFPKVFINSSSQDSVLSALLCSLSSKTPFKGHHLHTLSKRPPCSLVSLKNLHTDKVTMETGTHCYRPCSVLKHAVRTNPTPGKNRVAINRCFCPQISPRRSSYTSHRQKKSSSLWPVCSSSMLFSVQSQVVICQLAKRGVSSHVYQWVSALPQDRHTLLISHQYSLSFHLSYSVPPASHHPHSINFLIALPSIASLWLSGRLIYLLCPCIFALSQSVY